MVSIFHPGRSLAIFSLRGAYRPFLYASVLARQSPAQSFGRVNSTSWIYITRRSQCTAQASSLFLRASTRALHPPRLGPGPRQQVRHTFAASHLRHQYCGFPM